MWSWWNGIVSGNTPYSLNPSKAKLLKLCLKDEFHTLRKDTPFHLRNNDGPVIIPEAVYAVDESIHGSGFKSIDQQSFFDHKLKILRKINLGRAHTYIHDKAVRLVTTSPYDAFMFEECDLDSLKVLKGFLVYSDHEPHEELVLAVSRETKEILVLGDLKYNICDYLHTIQDKMTCQ